MKTSSLIIVILCVLAVGSLASPHMSHFMPSLPNRFPPKIKAGVSVACNNSIQALLAAYQGCPDVSPAAYGNLLNPASLPTDVITYCNSTCRKNVINVATSVQGSCSGAEILGIENFYKGMGVRFSLRAIIGALNLPCVTFATDLCYLKFKALGAIIQAPTPVALAANCNPCIDIFVKALIEFADPQILNDPVFQSLGALCVRDNTTWCWPKFLQNKANPQPSVVCMDRCFSKVLAYLQQFSQASATQSANMTAQASARGYIASIDALCVRNEAGAFCSDFLTNSNSLANLASLVTACNIIPGAPAPPCTPTCKTSLQQSVIKPFGCCFATLLPTFSKYGPFNFDIVMINSFFGSCGLPNVTNCGVAVRNRVTTFLRLKNLAWTYVSANMNQVMADLAYDLAGNFGFGPSSVSATVSQQAGGGQGTDVTAVIMDSSPNSNLPSDIQAAVSGGTLTFSTISSYPADSKIDATSDITADTSASSTTNVEVAQSSTGPSNPTSTPSAATSVYPMFGLLVLLGLSLLF